MTEASLSAAPAAVVESTLTRRAAAEGLATAFLLAAVVGSGIMGERLAGGNVAIALLANTIATGAALVVLILVFGPVSGAHMNPAVTLSAALLKEQRWSEVPAYVAAQILGGFAGVALANVMFEVPALFPSQTARAGTGQWVAEVTATFGLVLVIWGSVRERPASVAYVVGGYITAAYWFTSSTSFANPAVTLARMASDTFAGIRPADAPAFIVAQVLGALIAVPAVLYLFAEKPKGSE